MDWWNTAAYRKELPMGGLTPPQFLQMIYEMTPELGWIPLGVDGSALVCRTPPGDLSQGELISIVAGEAQCTLSVLPVNEYFWDEAQLQAVAGRLEAALPEAIAEQQRSLRSRNPIGRERYGALVPSRTYLATPLILYLITLVYLLGLFAGMSPLAPDAMALFRWGALSRVAVMGGDWWRLLSCMFLHAGVWHWLMNCYALLYIGMFLEPLMGHFRFTAAYLLSGICGGLLSIVMHSSSVSVGASGAIFGMYGVFLALLTTKHLQQTAKKTMMRSILFFVVFNLLMGLKGNTDNAAHIGGLLSGLLIGYAYYPGIRSEAGWSSRLAATAVLLLGVVLLIAFTVSRLA